MATMFRWWQNASSFDIIGEQVPSFQETLSFNHTDCGTWRDRYSAGKMHCCPFRGLGFVPRTYASEASITSPPRDLMTSCLQVHLQSLFFHSYRYLNNNNKNKCEGVMCCKIQYLNISSLLNVFWKHVFTERTEKEKKDRIDTNRNQNI